MDIILYIIIFIIGILFGSFFTLATHRIPLKEDITHTRSYCPKCKHKLAFFDMIPLLSYIFLGGKCRYCKEKIKSKYFLFELLTGIVFVLFAHSINLSFANLTSGIIAYAIFGVLYLTGLFIMAGIDKENHDINNNVLLYTVIIETMYIIYLYIVGNTNIYRYVIYLFLVVIFVLLNNLYYHKHLNNNYTLEIIILVLIMCIATNEYCTILSIICSLFAIGFYSLLKGIKKKTNKVVKNDKNVTEKMPFGYYLCVGNIIMFLFVNFLTFYRG